MRPHVFVRILLISAMLVGLSAWLGGSSQPVLAQGGTTIFLPLVESGGPAPSRPPIVIAQTGPVPLTGFPDSSPIQPDKSDQSGKFINVTRGLASLGDVGAQQQVFNLSIAIPKSVETGQPGGFELEIFDGDMGGLWDRLATGNVGDQLTFRLFRDPLLEGNVTAGDQLYAWSGSGMPDDGWCRLNTSGGCDPASTALLPHDAAAFNPTANAYFYHLVADWNTPLLYDDEQSVFKVRVRGTPFLLAGSTIGFEGFWCNPTQALCEPGSEFYYPSPGYDGAFEFNFVLPDSADEIDLFDGDFDLFDLVASDSDTDDPNTPPWLPNCGNNPGAGGDNSATCPGENYDPAVTFPPFQTSPDTLVEGANAGDPKDDQPTAFYLVEPNVYYQVESPSGWTRTNDNVSGNQEWEVFRIGRDGAGVQDVDTTAPDMPAGAYKWRIFGVDGLNTLFVHLEYDLFPTLPDIGNTVWFDTDPDGFWDQGSEPGINGVLVNLWLDKNQNGQIDPGIDELLESQTTQNNGIYDGQYLFVDVPIDVVDTYYLVEIDPSNFDPGGPLYQHLQTVDKSGEVGDHYNRSTPWQVIMPPANVDYLKADFGYLKSPQCDLEVAKTCVVPQPPAGNFVCKDAKPLDELTMIWNGAQAVRIKAYKGGTSTAPLADIDNIQPGQEVTVSGYAGSPNDVIWEIFAAGTSTKIGQSTFHLSCSDADMNGPEDCGKMAGDGKALTGYINQWKFEGMAGNGKRLDCTAPPPGPDLPGATLCEVKPPAPVSCETAGKPVSLTFQYTGGGCAASNNLQSGKATCSGSVDPSLAVNVSTTNSGYTIVLATVEPGKEFTVSASKFSADSTFKLTNGAGTETLKIHTSCSQKLEVGNVFGSLTLVAFNGQRGSSPIQYYYKVTNEGAALQNVNLVDDKLGPIAGPFSLTTGQSQIFSKAANIFEDTTNVATVTGYDGGNICVAQASAKVVVKPPPGGGQGCTPGYWKQKQHFDSWVAPYIPTGKDASQFSAVFGVDYDKTLLEALGAGGGGHKALGRHAVAALLNAAANSGVSYAYSTDEVIAMVQQAYASGDYETAKDLLAEENEMGCPLN